MGNLTLVLISDTHTREKQISVPNGDVLIHCGDSCGHGHFWEFRNFLKWFGSQPHKHKLLIAGNHDRCLVFDMDLCHAELKKYPEITYLEDTGVEIEGVKFWGSPWTPKFLNWYFMRPRGLGIKKHWDLIPDDTDVLITHGPPIGILDKVEPHPDNPGTTAGCEELLKAVQRVKPLIHVFGHIHGSYGVAKPKDEVTSFYNVSTCTEEYQPTNPPVVLTVSTEVEDGE